MTQGANLEQFDLDELRSQVSLLEQYRAGALCKSPGMRERMEMNLHARAILFRIRHPSAEAYVRKHGWIVGGFLALGFAYLWLYRAWVRVPSWSDLLADPGTLAGAAAAVGLGLWLGHWRIRYEWRDQMRKLAAALEYTERVRRASTTEGSTTRP